MVVGQRWQAPDVDKHLLCVMYLPHHQAGCGGGRTQGDAQRTVRDRCETFLEHLPLLWKFPCLFSSIFGTSILGIALFTGYASHGETVVSHVGSVARIRAMPSVPLNPAGCSQRFPERKIKIYSDFGGLKMHSVH